ncbi:MAG: cobalamin-dependent protein [Pseudomonadota bacterium]|nr:cobalamin-dependent protein [Pseudomonadota bacterium]
MPPPRILIVYANPATTATPVAPYGAERIAHAFRVAGCEVQVVSPWLQWKPARALDALLDTFKPDLVGFSVRNVDDALIVRSAEGDTDLDTTFYLPAIRRLVQRVQARKLPILLGGAALATMPEGVMRYLRVSHAIVGPADDLVWRLGRALVQGTPFPEALPADPRVATLRDTGTVPVGNGTVPVGAGPIPDRARGDADAWRPVPGPTPRQPEWLALARARGGRVPVAFSAGCDRRCHFCVEASFLGWRVRPRPVDEIVHEVTLLRRAGVRRVWLAASELNVPDARHATALLHALAAAKLDVEVTGFLQPAPVDDALLDAFVAVGVDPATLSWEFGHLDDGLLRAGAGPANRASLDRLVDTYVRRGHAVLGGSILLGAHPLETDATVDSAIATARMYDAALPGGLGLAYAAGGRVYPAAPLGRWVRDHLAEAGPHLYGRRSVGFVAPLVFCRPGSPRALLRRIQDALVGCKGPMAPLNAEAAATPAALAAEKWINLAVLHAAAADVPAAEHAARAALRRAPDHPEALKQLGLVLANRKGDVDGALVVFRRLAGVVSVPAHVAEVEGVIQQLVALQATAAAGAP